MGDRSNINRQWLVGQKMEIQTGPKKNHTEKICVTILDKVQIQRTWKEHKPRGAIWCVTYLYRFLVLH